MAKIKSTMTPQRSSSTTQASSALFGTKLNLSEQKLASLEEKLDLLKTLSAQEQKKEQASDSLSQADSSSGHSHQAAIEKLLALDQKISTLEQKIATLQTNHKSSIQENEKEDRTAEPVSFSISEAVSMKDKAATSSSSGMDDTVSGQSETETKKEDVSGTEENNEDSDADGMDVVSKIRFLPSQHKTKPIESPYRPASGEEAKTDSNLEASAKENASSGDKKSDEAATHSSSSSKDASQPSFPVDIDLPASPHTSASEHASHGDDHSEEPADMANPIKTRPKKLLFSFLDKIVPSKANASSLMSLAVTCLWVAMILSIVRIVHSFYDAPVSVLSLLQNVSIALTLFIFLANTILIFFIEKGKGWARTFFVFLNIIEMVPSIVDIFHLFRTPLVSLSIIADIALKVYAVWILYSPKVDPVFELHKQSGEK